MAYADRRKSYAETATIKGDRARRVAVPMPQKVKDLENQATRYFGLDKATVKLVHRGQDPLHHDGQLRNVIPGDVVVAHGKRPKGERHQTTHQRDYRGHEFEPAARPLPRQPPKSLPFTGRSHYHDSYQPHDISPQPSPTPRRPPPHLPFNGSSTYQSHYPGHPVEPAPTTPPRKPKPALPFQGNSTYNEAYRGHDITPPPVAPPRKPRPNLPFEGSSTYNRDYPGHEVEVPLPPKPRTAGPRLPFQGNSEYQMNYVDKGVDIPRYMFIEPAMSERSMSLGSSAN
mmetsp:Transcript_95390/g.189080  ORF Transcript_95390/g.189080 Transcript_95390/m.189080 type:complete len:285 (+) Transcript_95390:53-907(+)